MSMPRSSSTKEDLYSTSAMRGASTGRPHSRKMNSFASTALPNTASGIWESTTKSRTRPRDTTNFPMGISKMSTAVACSLRKAARASTNTMTLRSRQRTCMECWTPGRVPQLRSATQQLPLAQRRAGPDIRCDDRIAVSAVHDPKDQAEQHAHKQTCHQREVERHILSLDHDVAGQPSQPDPAQIGPKQAGHQDCKAEDDQKARHRCQSSRAIASTLSALTEQLKQQHEKIYEVEIERQRTEHCLLACDFNRVRLEIHLLDTLRVICGKAHEYDDADDGDGELKSA